MKNNARGARTSPKDPMATAVVLVLALLREDEPSEEHDFHLAAPLAQLTRHPR